MTISLYIHIPFCYAKCEYCDFFSVPLKSLKDNKIVENTLNAVLDELKIKFDMIPDPLVDTIFIGGGTPSVIDNSLLNDFLYELDNITSAFRSPDLEYTTECNIESCSGDFIKIISEAGINRLSVGVQSFNTLTLEDLGRACYPEKIYEAAENIKTSWDKKLSLDLISGVNKDYRNDIANAGKLGPGHLSVYQLTVEENTELHNKILTEEKTAPDEKLQAESLCFANEYLSRSGYERYEISNFAKPGCECRHNLAYWNMQSYIGAGPSAVSSLYFPDRKVRYTNTCKLENYLNGPEYSIENLSDFDFLVEHFLMGCRLIKGIDKEIFKQRFGALPESFIPDTVLSWTEMGLMKTDGFGLNERGLFFLDSFLSDVYKELSEKNKKI